MDAPSENEVTAYHEAGHAVAALALDRPVRKVTIRPDRDRLGWCEFGKGVFRPSQDWLENELLIALGGIAAERLFRGEFDPVGAGTDLKMARKLAIMRAGDRQAPRLEERTLKKAENLLSDEANWAAVEAIARELLEKTEISGRAAAHLFERAVAEEEG